MRKNKIRIAKSWKNYLCKMGKGELLFIVYDRENYCKEFVALAEEVLQQQYGLTKKEIRSLPEPDKFGDGEPGTRNLFLDVLARMGCVRAFGFESDDLEDDGKCDFSFLYMGELYYACATNDRVYVEIYKSCCYFCLDDKEEIAIVKEAINKVNEEYIAKMYYSIDEEDNCLYVKCHTIFMLIPLIRNLEIYVYQHLKYIMGAGRYFDSVLEELKN